MNENFTQKINVEINRIVNQTFPIYSADSSQMGRIELANKIQYNTICIVSQAKSVSGLFFKRPTLR